MTKSSDKHQRVLDAERAVNERYVGEQEAWLKNLKTKPKLVAVPRSAVWADQVPKTSPGRSVVGPLIGRVALSEDTEDIGRGFYVGVWYREVGDATVVSWAAPIAQLFFSGRNADRDGFGVDPKLVAASRSFKSRGNDLKNFADDLESGVSADSVFVDEKAILKVPRAPSAPSRPSRPKRRSPVSPNVSDDPSAPPESVEVAGASEPQKPIIDLRGRKLRAEKLVLETIVEPKTGKLHSVLETLQADQYRLVTWPATSSLLVQGQPGSGKTIVAAHRACYLTNIERKDRLDRVALIGPSEGWKKHVSSAVSDLGGRGVVVLSLPGLVREIARKSKHELHVQSERWTDTCWQLGRVVDRAVTRLSDQLGPGISAKERERIVVDHLVTSSQLHRDLVADSDLSSWLLSGGNWKEARGNPRFLPFFAAVQMALYPPKPDERFQHLVIDEAQDIRPMIWRLLSGLLDDDGAWSLFGDINQRRSDCSIQSWSAVDSMLEIGVHEQVLATGYRSTNQILKFASKLLPKGSRGISGLCDGPEVEVVKVAARELPDAASRAASSLSASYPDGSVAVVASPDRMGEVTKALMAAGWRSDGRDGVGRIAGRPVSILRPVQARGLEFDGVVVVEPLSFPENLGRRGQLYTSLTRANKELRVVHSRRLPKELK